MVREYTKPSLTYDSDKLPGVAGLAALGAEQDNGKYCAVYGWKTCLLGFVGGRSLD